MPVFKREESTLVGVAVAGVVPAREMNVGETRSRRMMSADDLPAIDNGFLARASNLLRISLAVDKVSNIDTELRISLHRR